MATRTLTALFDSRADAECAQTRLIEIGIPSGVIHLIDQSTSAPSTRAGEPMGFWEKLKHIFLPNDDRDVYEEGIRRGGVLLTTPVDDRLADLAITALEECKPIDLEQRQKEWRSGGWTGFSAAERSARPQGIEPSASRTGAQEEVIPVAEERLRVGKREVNRGGVRVRSYIVEEPIQEEVRLREEHVDIERRPINEPAAPGAQEALMQERTVEMRETAEEPVVQKDTQVKEEVVVRKRAEERVEQVQDKVRRTEVDIEKGAEPEEPPPKGPKGRPEQRQPPRH